MKKQEYTPSPIDVSDVQLPEELKKLSELLAKNVHETWSEARMKMMPQKNIRVLSLLKNCRIRKRLMTGLLPKEHLN